MPVTTVGIRMDKLGFKRKGVQNAAYCLVGVTLKTSFVSDFLRSNGIFWGCRENGAEKLPKKKEKTNRSNGDWGDSRKGFHSSKKKGGPPTLA